jgi:DNA-directed RNA polymerase specialized sigma24 family protein
VIEGEHVVQDAFARALVAVNELDEAPPLRPWLFRIDHTRALDLSVAAQSAQLSLSRRPTKSPI